MLRLVWKRLTPSNGLNPPPGMPLRQTLMLKCGHLARRLPKKSGMWVSVHCEMCTMLEKERSSKDTRRAAKKERRRLRRLRTQMKVEKLIMAKKKMAPAKVAKKKDLKKKGGKVKGPKVKVGRKLILVGTNCFAPKNSLLSKILKAMEAADDHTMGENELVVAMEKAGVKAEGKKTVKKLVKGTLRNMLRAGVVVKQREVKNNAELKAHIDAIDGDGEEEDGDGDEDDGDGDDESEDEDESDDDAGDDESSDDDSDEEDDDEEGDDEAKKKVAKKKVVGKKK